MRAYRYYDHRLKRAIWLSGDPTLFPELGIPRSTAKGWIRRGVPEVVTADDVVLSGVRRQSIWHHLSLFLRDTFLPVLSPV